MIRVREQRAETEFPAITWKAEYNQWVPYLGEDSLDKGWTPDEFRDKVEFTINGGDLGKSIEIVNASKSSNIAIECDGWKLWFSYQKGNSGWKLSNDVDIDAEITAYAITGVCVAIGEARASDKRWHDFLSNSRTEWMAEHPIEVKEYNDITQECARRQKAEEERRRLKETQFEALVREAESLIIRRGYTMFNDPHTKKEWEFVIRTDLAYSEFAHPFIEVLKDPHYDWKLTSKLTGLWARLVRPRVMPIDKVTTKTQKGQSTENIYVLRKESQ